MIAALVPGSRTRRRKRSFTIGVGIGLMVPVLVLLVLSLLPRGDLTSTPVAPEIAEQQRALAAFEDTLAPVIEHGAATVVYGMRPGINDIYAGSLDDETLASMAQGWIEATQRLRGDFAAIEVPSFLAETADLYRRSFDAYHETAKALLAAAQATGEARTNHITRAADHGTRADQLYDTAQAELEAHRVRLRPEGTGRAG